MHQLIGRSPELSLLRQCASAARLGSRQVVVVDGPAGIGKSTLVRAFISAGLEDGATVHTVACSEEEQAVAFGLLGLLAAAVGDRPERWAAGTFVDPFTAGAALLDLLSQQSTDLVLAVDDLQWADGPSLGALAFALRRLPHDRLLVVCTVRLPCPEEQVAPFYALAEEGGATISLPGMTVDELRDLASGLGVGSVSRRALERLHRHTAGNPLFARMLVTDVEALHDPREVIPQASKPFEAAVARRMDQLGEVGRRLVEAAAVLGPTSSFAAAADLAGLLDPDHDVGLDRAVDEAAAADLLAVQEGSTGRQLAFTHPVVRLAAYHHTPLAQRSMLHRRAAAALQVMQPRAALRHELLGTAGPDDEVADRSALTAAADEETGSWASASAWWLAAARLRRDRATHEAELLRSALCLVVAGDLPAARALLAGAGDLADGAMLRFLRGRVASLSGDLEAGMADLLQAWEWREGDRLVAALTASHLSAVTLGSADGAVSARWALRAVELEEAGTGRLDVDPLSRYLIAMAVAGRVDEGLAFTEAHVERFGDPAVDRLDGLLGRAMLHDVAGHSDRAERELDRVAEASRRVGPFHLWCYTQAWHAAAAYHAGHWDRAVRYAVEATSAADAEAWSFAVAGCCALAVPLISRGDRAGAEAAIAQAHDCAARAGDNPILSVAILAVEAWGEMVWGEHQRVVDLVEPWLGLPAFALDVIAAPPPVRTFGQACLRLGRDDGVADAVVRLEGQRNPAGPAWAATFRMGLAHGGSTEDAKAALEAARPLVAAVAAPFERGTLLLKLGLQSRRSGQRTAAIGLLREAQALIGPLGAAPFDRRADQELAMSGVKAPSRPTGGVSLTPTEQIVVGMVRDGRTNREIASELVVSIKTVEYHLSNMYRKVGVSNRTGLLNVLDD